ncbi:MAG: HAD-IA family hydrolase [Lachnospiraceae bacterium]|nr:HAD-IA family hydrolase [Lachnospiraceae bacterium]
MKKEELVSIIIPVYNVREYIKKCLYSVLNQTYKNIEIIIVNDGSEQNEEEVIKEIIKDDSRVIYIKKQSNEGLYAARITGVKHSKGKFIAFVDSDDYINPEFIRLLVEKAKAEDADLVFSSTVLCTPKGSETKLAFMDAELHKLPLEGNKLREVYWNQYGCAYVWHTVWNKLYDRELWDEAIPYLERMTEHHVMTEDIIFSSIIYYFVKKAVLSRNSVYFYCKHKEASTYSSFDNIQQYKEKVGEVIRTFNFVYDFYKNKEEWIKKSILRFRKYYGRIWQRVAESFCDPYKEEALCFCSKLSEVTHITTSAMDDNYFCYMEVPYDNNIDSIKKRIQNGKEKIISFDMFDTLVYRPLYRPSDIFFMLDKKYDTYTDSSISFYNIRIHGEEACRNKLCSDGREDISINDIYDYICEVYGIDKKICDEIKEYEMQLELEFNIRRNVGYELFNLALLSRKTVIVTSDMYLETEFLDRLLRKNGYRGYSNIYVSSKYGALKKSGKLFNEIIKQLNVLPTDILHIGDNIESDIQGAEKEGVKAILLPSALNAFSGKTKKLINKHRFLLGRAAGGESIGKKSFENLPGYGAAIALSAIKFFDNPYIGYNDLTDFNVDPYLAGYYVLGMNIIGQIEWLKKVIKNNNIKRVLFTSRDGKLLRDAFLVYKNFQNIQVETMYINVSRRSMMPWIIVGKKDFFELPIVYSKYTPKAIEDLLYFCVKSNDKEWRNELNSRSIELDKRFESLDEYHAFIKLFIQYRYDSDKHNKARRIISEYFSFVSDDDGIYDLGYSASIHRAICLATKKKPRALFVHTDEYKHLANSRREGFDIEAYLNSIPDISGLMREVFFSGTCGSCIGYKENQDIIEPIIENENKHYTDLFPIEMMQKGALDMVKDFYKFFGDYLPYMSIREQEFGMPFEDFLINPTPLDTKMFISSYFEDKVYGRIDKINIRDFWMELIVGRNGNRKYDVNNLLGELLKKHNKKKIGFFGTGKMCKAILEDYPQLKVDVFFDNDPNKSSKEINGTRIINPSEYNNLKEVYIVIVITFYKEIEEQLKEYGLIKYDDFLSYLELF